MAALSSTFTASIVKKSKYVAKLGLTLQQQQHHQDDVITIKDVSSNFKKKTALVPGLRVLEINKTKLSSLQQANQLLEETAVNFEISVTVQAQIVSATKKKALSPKRKRLSFGRFSNDENNENNGDSKIGISLFEDPESAQISITHVEPNGLFPTLKVNTILHAINGTLVSSIDFSKVLDMMKQSKTLTLVALETTNEEGSPSQPPESQQVKALHTSKNGSSGKIRNISKDCTVEMDEGEQQITTSDVCNEPVRVVACIIRPTKNVPLGLTLEEQEEEFVANDEEVEKPDGGNGNIEENKPEAQDVVKTRQKLVVTAVEEKGLFAHTGLQPNMELVKINGHVWTNIRKHKLDKATKLLQQATGRISLEAISHESKSTPKANNSKTIGGRLIFSIEKANRNFALGLKLAKPANSQKVKIIEASPVFENVLGLKSGLLLSKVNNTIVTSVQKAQDLMADAFPILSLECSALPPPDKQSLLQQEYLLAKHALPVTVTDENKATAKIVRTTVCELPADTKLQNMWTLAKHPALNGIVIADIPKTSPFFAYFAVGQVVVSINHNTCPQTSAGTYKLLQKEVSRAAAMAADPELRASADAAKAATVVRVEAGDIQHEHTPTTEEEEEMHQVVQLAIARAENELLDQKRNNMGADDSQDPPELVSESDPKVNKSKDMFALPDDLDLPEHPTIQVDFDEGVQLPKTPKNLAKPQVQILQWSRSKPEPTEGGVPVEIGLFEASPSPLKIDTPIANIGVVPEDNDSEKAQAKCTIPKDFDEKKENEIVRGRILFKAKEPISPEPGNSQPLAEKVVSAAQVTPSLREKELQEEIAKIQSKLESAQNALKSAEMKQEKALQDSNGEITALLQQLEEANKARQVVSHAQGTAREKELQEEMARIQSKLESAKGALKSAEKKQEKDLQDSTREISTLRQQLEEANEARQVAEDGIRQIGVEVDRELKAATEAKIMEEKQREELKEMLETLQEESRKSKADASAANDKFRNMVLEVQTSCSYAKEEILRMHTEKARELKAVVEEKEKMEQQLRRLKAQLQEAESEHKAALKSKQVEIEEKSAEIASLESEIPSLKRQLQQAEEAKGEANEHLDKAKAEHEHEIIRMKEQIALVREEEEAKADEREARTRSEADDAVGSMLAMQRQDKEEMVNLRNIIEDTQIALHDKELELEKLHTEYSILRTQETNRAKAVQEALENELGVHREQVATLQASLVAAEKVRQMSKSEVKAVKSDGQVKLQGETEARRRAEKEIVRLEAEVDKAVKEEQETKQLLEKLKKEYAQTTTVIEAREQKNRSMAEEAREKAEIIVADIGVAEERRIKAEVEVVKTRRTWSLISLVFFVIAIVSVRTNNSQSGYIPPDLVDADLSNDALREMVQKEIALKLQLEEAVQAAKQDREKLLEEKEAAEQKADEAMKEATRKETLLQQVRAQNKGKMTKGDDKSPSEKQESQSGRRNKAEIVAKRRAAAIEIYFE